MHFCVRCTFLFLSLICLLSFPLSFFGVCWCMFLSFRFCSYSFFSLDYFLALLLSSVSLLVPPPPFKNVLCSSVVLHVSIRLLFSHLSPQQCLAFWHLFDFRSFILSDLCCVTKFVMICLLAKNFTIFFTLSYLHNTDHLVHRLRTTPTSSAALSLAKAAAGGGGNRTGIWLLYLDRHQVVRPRSRGWICPVQGGHWAQVVLPGRWRRLKRVMTEMRGGKGREGVSHPIPIAEGKMKKRVKYNCECCNKVGWFYLI